MTKFRATSRRCATRQQSVRPLLILVLISLSLSSCAKRRYALHWEGEISRKKTADSVTITYQLFPRGGCPSSVVLQYFPNCSTSVMSDSSAITSRQIWPDSLAHFANLPDDSLPKKLPPITGSVTIQTASTTRRDRYRLTAFYRSMYPYRLLSETHTHSLESLIVESPFENPWGGFFKVGYGLGAFRKDNFGPYNRFERSSAAGSYEIEIGRAGQQFRIVAFTLGTHGLVRPGPYTFYEYAGIKGRWTPGTPHRITPFLSGGFKYGRVKASDSLNETSLDDVGIEAGVGASMRFGELAYSYSNYLGGFHRIDLMMACLAEPFGTRIGTCYTFRYGRYVRQFDIKIVVEGLWDGESTSVRYHDHRNRVLRILSGVGLVFVFPILMGG